MSFALIIELLEEASQKEKRFEYLEKMLEPNWKGVEGYKKLKDFLKAVMDADPTKNGAYMQWIAQRIIKSPDHNRAEDLDRLKNDLELFGEHKAKLEVKDINAYKTFGDLFTAIEPHTKPRELTADEKKAKKAEEEIAKAKEGIEDVYAGPDGWIKIPTTKKAACFLGQNTRWCTAMRDAGHFDSYNRTDKLFVIYDKAQKARFQLHFNSGQFADEADRTKGLKTIPEWARKPIIEWYKKNTKHLGLKHVFAFAELGDTSAAKGTDHEEVIAMMKQYGVL